MLQRLVYVEIIKKKEMKNVMTETKRMGMVVPHNVSWNVKIQK